MIDFFYYPSPNTRKVLVALEELGLPYAIRWTDISAGDQHTAEYRAINPNGKVPAIIDHDGPGGRALVLFESGAILEYLADKTGGGLMPVDPIDAWRARAWIYWQVANQGPMAGQAAHFLTYAPDRGLDVQYAQERYLRAVRHTYEVLENELLDREYLVGEYSMADIACFPWTRVARGHGVDLAEFPAVRAWSDRIRQRPAVNVEIPDHRDEHARNFQYTDDQWKALFGAPPPGPRR
jgi:GSH-dependent disulfide-bond oxidoreductase